LAETVPVWTQNNQNFAPYVPFLGGFPDLGDLFEAVQHFFSSLLEQHQSVELIVAATFGSGVRVHIKLLWDDETGTDNEKELTPVV